MTRRRLKPDQRRELIIAAAAETFGRHGHRAARMEDIARAAGTTKAVLYDHFESKESLHAEVVARASDAIVTAVGEAVLAAGDDGEARFRAGALRSFELIAARADVRTLLLGEAGTGDEVARASREAQIRARSALAAIYLLDPTYLAGHPDRVQRAEHLAQGAIGAMNGLAVLGVQDGLTPAELTDLAMTMLWPGVDALRRP